MRGPFRVRWKDYFGFEHEDIFWAQGAGPQNLICI